MQYSYFQGVTSKKQLTPFSQFTSFPTDIAQKKKKYIKRWRTSKTLKKTHFESNETKLNNFFLSYLFQLRFLFHLNVTALHFYFGKHNLVNIIIPNSALKKLRNFRLFHVFQAPLSNSMLFQLFQVE